MDRAHYPGVRCRFPTDLPSDRGTWLAGLPWEDGIERAGSRRGLVATWFNQPGPGMDPGIDLGNSLRPACRAVAEEEACRAVPLSQMWTGLDGRHYLLGGAWWLRV